MTAIGPFAELAVLTRSGIVESAHLGSLVLVAGDGNLEVELGDPDAAILPRSTAKPVQAVACLRAGVALEGAELAVVAASHTGRDEHVRVVRGILEHAGLDESALCCPAEYPEDEQTLRRMLCAGEPPSAIRMNCSGKHAGMLLACRMNGWPTGSYLDPAHPLQRLVRETKAEFTGVEVEHIAVDGCGAPLFSTTVRGLARAFRTLVLAEPGSAAESVASAMRRYPTMVAGPGHPNSTLMDSVPGALAKGGAEGVIAVAAPDGTSVATKILDGSPRATTMLALAALAAVGVEVSAAGELARVPVLGGGVPVGQIDIGADLAGALARVRDVR